MAEYPPQGGIVDFGPHVLHDEDYRITALFVVQPDAERKQRPLGVLHIRDFRAPR